MLQIALSSYLDRRLQAYLPLSLRDGALPRDVGATLMAGSIDGCVETAVLVLGPTQHCCFSAAVAIKTG